MDETIIINVCAKVFGVTKKEVLSDSRLRDIVNARFCAMYMCRHYYDNLSVSSIARKFNRTHASVLHAIQIIDNLKSTDKIFKQIIINIQNKLDHEFTIRNLFQSRNVGNYRQYAEIERRKRRINNYFDKRRNKRVRAKCDSLRVAK